MCTLHLSFILLLAISLSAAVDPVLPNDCPCGYVDRTNDRLFTDAIIVYFNETQAIEPSVFVTQSFEDKKQKGRGSIFRRSASPSNVGIGNTSNLQLFVEEYTSEHLVRGAELRTVRQDIQYGSFRASMRSPSWGAGGSALSLTLKYNDSESLELDILNMDDSRLAKVTNLINGELPAEDISTNFTTLQDGLGLTSSAVPWDFVDYRIEWTDHEVAFWANTILTREAAPTNRTLPGIPQPLYLSHWSTGDSGYMQGPPAHRSEANVAWIRTFFNSSLMTAQEHRLFDSRCQKWTACSMEDPSLRGSTPYRLAATSAFTEPPRNEDLRIPAAMVAGICSVFGVFALVNSFIRTVPRHKLGRAGQRKEKSEPNRPLLHSPYQQPAARPKYESERSLVDPAKPDFLIVPSEGTYTGQSTPCALGFSISGRPITMEPFCTDLYESSWDTSSPSLSQRSHGEAATEEGEVGAVARMRAKIADDEISPKDPDVCTLRDSAGCKSCPEDEKGDGRSGMNAVVMSLEGGSLANDVGALTVLDGAAMHIPVQERVDYLAGLVAMTSLWISARHFVLTFWPYVAMGYGNTKHYDWEHWTYIFIGSYFLTPLWLGPFFVTSCRFLSAGYLREGKLADVAKKALLRGPRLLTPVAIVAILEYFFISLGLIDTINWLPSISWSTWLEVTPQENFGVFMNNIVELAYFIPSGAPEIATHFCVGVLWTIPVQLQFSYLVLLATVMIRDVKIPRKRFGYYTCCIVLGWYARSWSACFWVGLLLTDLDITCRWTTWMQSRPRVLYPVLAASIMVAMGTPLFLSFSIGYSFMINEHDMHPDVQTGLPLGATTRRGYPNYYEPSLAIIIFSASIQIIADLSVWVQKFLSIWPLLRMRPHIMTIYLVHGMIFWSVGAWVCVALGAADVVPYWANVLITLLICYVVIGLVTIILTPLIEFTTTSTMKNLWRWALEEPVPKVPTTGKFSKALVLDRSVYIAQVKEA